MLDMQWALNKYLVKEWMNEYSCVEFLLHVVEEGIPFWPLEHHTGEFSQDFLLKIVVGRVQWKVCIPLAAILMFESVLEALLTASFPYSGTETVSQSYVTCFQGKGEYVSLNFPDLH